MPGLTPTGFSQWLIANIKAYPDEEARRLASIVLQVPLSVANTADGKLERMPRLISRGLLPQQPDIKARKILDEALKDFIEDSETIPSPSPSSSRFSGLNLNIPASSASRLPAVPTSPHRDPNRYKPTRDQHYPDRGGSTSSRREPRGSGYVEAVDWSPDGHSSYHSRHGSIPLSPTSERDKAPLPAPPPPPPPAGRRNRSPQSRRHSHTAVNVMQSHPPTPMAGETEYAAQLSSSGGLLSPKTTYPPSGGGGGGGPMSSSPPTLSPEQLATIRERSPRHGRDKDYYSLQRQLQSSYVPSSRASRHSVDGAAVLVPGQMPRSSGSHREYDRDGAKETSPHRTRRRGTAAPEDVKGHGWDDAPRHKGK